MIISPVPSYETMGVPTEFWKGLPVVRGKRVFVKPNLVNPLTPWDTSSTTRLEVVEFVVRKLIDEGAASIFVGDCGFKNQWEATVRSTGYDTLVRTFPGVELVPLQDGGNFHRFTLVRSEVGSYLSLFGAKFSDYVLESDVVVNVPKLKVHTMAVVTGAIKNMMGTMAQKGSMHPRGDIETLHRRLRDFYFLTRKFVGFVVVDGIDGAEYSEQVGVPRHSGVLISSTDQWEADIASAILMGVPPEKVPYLRLIGPIPKIEVPEQYIQRYERPIRWRQL